MESALEEIEFLALSSNRVKALRLLAAGRRTRNELAADIGASQATVGRILGDFGERSWIRRDDGGYVATATGELVADGFTNLLEILETEGDLRGIVRYLPTHAMDIDLRHLADATITTPSQTRPNAPIQRLLDLLRGADEVRAFSYAFNEQSLTAIQERTTRGDQTFRGVFLQRTVDTLTGDSELRRRFTALLDAEGAEVRIHKEELPLAVTLTDDVVVLLLRDENGVLQASVDTADRSVHSWARDTFDRYWRTSTPLDRDEYRP